MTRRLTLVASPEPTVTFIPAPRILVKRLANAAPMGLFPITQHQLAGQIARRWGGTLELVPVKPTPRSSDTAGGTGTPR